MSKTTVKDFYELKDFENLLDNASIGASTNEEINFVDDITTRFEEYSLMAFITEKQIKWLEKLSERVLQL